MAAQKKQNTGRGGKPHSFETIGGFIFDIDGTMAALDPKTRKFGPLPGAVKMLETLRKKDIPYLFFTNGTLHNIDNYVDRMNGIGLTIEKERMVTPSVVAAHTMKRQKVGSVLVLGEDGASKPLANLGFDITPASASDSELEAVDAVYIAWHPSFGYTDLSAACKAVWAGAKLYVSSKAKQFATAEGPALGISSSIAAAVTNATGKRAQLVGKPSVTAYRYAAKLLETQASEIAVVGDDTTLEPVFAAVGGGLGIGVETGLATAEDFAALPEKIRPEVIVKNLVELHKRLSAH